MVPHVQNLIPDAFVVATNTLEIVKDSPLKRFLVKLVPTPTIPDNIKHFQVFEDDKHILAFLANSGAFEDQIIDEDNLTIPVMKDRRR